MTMFCKRHFEAIARTLQDLDPCRFASTDHAELRVQHAETVRAIAGLFAGDNGSFKRDRFLRACQPGANVRARS